MDDDSPGLHAAFVALQRETNAVAPSADNLYVALSQAVRARLAGRMPLKGLKLLRELSVRGEVTAGAAAVRSLIEAVQAVQAEVGLQGAGRVASHHARAT